MNHPISSWLRKGALSLALVGLAGPSLASRTVTASDSGGPPPTALLPTSNLIVCNTGHATRATADDCSGFFNHGEEIDAVQALVGSYDGLRPGQAWAGGALVDTTRFTTFAGGRIADIQFNQNLAGSFVVVLSGTWTPPSTSTVNSPAPSNWSAYYLFDDVDMTAYVAGAGGESMEFRLFGDAVREPVTNAFLGVSVTTGMDIRKVSIYEFDVTRTANVPEPSSLLLSGLALGALGAAAALGRRRRLAGGSAPAL